jgi:hypothetical protein
VRGGLKTGKQGVSPPRGREIEAVLAIMGRFWAKWHFLGVKMGPKWGSKMGPKSGRKGGQNLGFRSSKKGVENRHFLSFSEAQKMGQNWALF